jgi:50S ribosomal protein L16 3-hydroxylase
MKPMTLLGGLTPEEFLQEYWQKKPLLIRGALTDVGPHVDFKCLSELAMQEDVESRLIENRNGKWHLERGPFRPARFASWVKPTGPYWYRM